MQLDLGWVYFKNPRTPTGILIRLSWNLALIVVNYWKIDWFISFIRWFQ